MAPLVWLCDLEGSLADALTGPLSARGVATTTAQRPNRAPDAVVLAWNARAALDDRLRRCGFNTVPLPARVYHAPLALAAAVSDGADDPFAGIILFPCRLEDLVLAILQALRRRAAVVSPAGRDGADRIDSYELIGQSAALRQTIASACQVAASPDTPVLVQGESGTGKDLVARLIHARAPGGLNRPFVDINCAAIPADLLEAELFGYERGAFTEAARDKAGLMELAHGGTLFLDEIGELNIALQAKLLRAIETQTFRRLGGVSSRRAACRVVASTNRNLLDAVQRGLFRLDLYHRLAVMTIQIAPLRERREDIMPIATQFLRTIGARVNRRVSGFSPAAAALLLGYPYPGNVRELRNIVERALILESGTLITPKALGVEVTNLADTVPFTAPAADLASGAVRSLEEEQRRHVEAALSQTAGNRTQAARLLGISVPTLYSKIRKYGLESVGRPAAPAP